MFKIVYYYSEFTAVCSYHVHEGSAHVYSVVIDDIVYQGEGTTSKIAKAIAATKALEGIQVREDNALVLSCCSPGQMALMWVRFGSQMF